METSLKKFFARSLIEALLTILLTCVSLLFTFFVGGFLALIWATGRLGWKWVMDWLRQ